MRKVALESWIIILIGVVDMSTTLYLAHHYGVSEGNPIFSLYLRMGEVWFIIAKMTMVVGPVFLLEWARRRKPIFVAWASRVAICSYLALYVLGVSHLNHPPMKKAVSSSVPPVFPPYSMQSQPIHGRQWNGNTFNQGR